MEFTNIVFAGGGNRCFWQAGFWETVSKEIELKPKTVASVSAGSAISCAIFANRIRETLDITKEVMAKNPANRYLKNIFGPDAVYPHNRLYRSIINQALDDSALAIMKQGPNNRILLAHIPKWLGPRSSVFLGLGAYQLEKLLLQPVHPSAGRTLGFKSEFVSAHNCANTRELSDLILSSSCTPPFTPLMYRKTRPILDGGMVDNVPVHGVQDRPGETLILLSRPYKKLPKISGRCYIQPSRKVDVDSWDYTNPNNVQRTFDLGCKDGLTFLKHLI